MHGNESKSEPSKSNNATTIHKAMHPTTYGQALRNSEREDTTTVTDTTADTRATVANTTTANNCTAQPHLPAFERNAWRLWSKADKQCSHRDAWIRAQRSPAHTPRALGPKGSQAISKQNDMQQEQTHLGGKTTLGFGGRQSFRGLSTRDSR